MKQKEHEMEGENIMNRQSYPYAQRIKHYAMKAYGWVDV
jgi:hypothetical protein